MYKDNLDMTRVVVRIHKLCQSCGTVLKIMHVFFSIRKVTSIFAMSKLPYIIDLAIATAFKEVMFYVRTCTLHIIVMPMVLL